MKLEDNVSIITSGTDPYDFILNTIAPYMDKTDTIPSGKIEIGYYRQAVLMDFDVYLTFSYQRIGPEAFEIGHYNDLTICPVSESVKYEFQYSENKVFKDNFDTHFVIKTKPLYDEAKSHPWGNWED